ncbi:MAG TPA: NAD-dependent succinate-semialdehyde dehydrogenase [Longimicrobiaceae bacterium]|nr:NAD-dependent succinate-semialdehyde dehydrogenase [Longimicrobiaceae bacterium]
MLELHVEVRSILRDPTLLVEQAFVGGEWLDGSASDRIAVVNPATLETIGSVPSFGATETREAIRVAEAVASEWGALPAANRARLLEAWYDAIMANHEDLAVLMTLEQGKPLAESRGEVTYGAAFVKWFAEQARRIYGETIPSPAADRRILTLRQPVGVVAAITPWNFPNAMITRKCAPALAAGCPVVIKPSEVTPFSALALARLAERVGFPAGVINVVTGPPEPIGAELTANPAVRKLSFTGSTAVGKLLMRQCAATVKRISLELGGNAPFIVFDDASLDLAIAGVLASKFRNAGQTCVCANRILVQDGIYEEFAERLSGAVSDLVVGNGMAEGVTIGPLINGPATEKVLGHIDDARAKGAKVNVGGGAHALGKHFVEPTVLTAATSRMRVAHEETFGPVAPLFRFGTEEEALELANSTRYGLAAYFYTENIRRSWRVAERLEFGMVGLNTGSISTEVAPFGGVKESGIGREGAQAGIDEYLETKAFHIGNVA